MKVGVIGAGTMGSGIAQAFAATEGYEVSQQYQVMSIDASNIDLYEVEFPHEPINVVDARKMPTTGLSPIYFMSSFGVSLTCLGVLIVRYLNHEEV